MNREQIIEFIAKTYGEAAEYPWTRYPRSMIFRHSDNRKWFALVMDISKQKLGLLQEEIVDILNVKCDPIVMGTLRGKRGFFPAYHMNKTSWITIVLDGSVDIETIKWLLDLSYDLTAKKSKGKQ